MITIEDEKILNEIDSLITTLIEKGIICTACEAERYTYCICFLKTLHDVGVLTTDNAMRISELFKQQCIDNIIDGSKVDSFYEDVRTYNEFFAMDRTETPGFIMDRMRSFSYPGLATSPQYIDLENVYVFYAVSLWEDEKNIGLISYKYLETLETFYDCSEDLYGYNPFIFHVEGDLLVDYIPKAVVNQGLIGNTMYIKIPDCIAGIKAKAFERLSSYDLDDHVESIRKCEYLYLPSNLEYLEPHCLRPLRRLRAVLCYQEYDKNEFYNTYIHDEEYPNSMYGSCVKLIRIDSSIYTDLVTDDCLSIKNRILEKCDRDAKGIVVIPEGVKAVGDRAFANCNYITEIHFPKSVSRIGKECFAECLLLKELVFDEEARFIMEPSAWKTAPMLFDKYKYEKIVVLGKTLVVYRDRDVLEKKYTVPGNIRFINKYAFAGRRMRKIAFDGEIEYVGDFAFAFNYGLREISLPNGLKKIGYGILNWCPILKIDYPKGLLFNPEEFKTNIGDLKIGQLEFVDVFVDDINCETEYVFEYIWTEANLYDWGLRHQKHIVNVNVHPRNSD